MKIRKNIINALLIGSLIIIGTCMADAKGRFPFTKKEIRAEVGKSGQLSSNITNIDSDYNYWTFELQNKWQERAVFINLYYYNEKKTSNRQNILGVYLMPFEKIRGVVDLSKKLLIVIEFVKKGKLVRKEFAFKPSKSLYKTIYITFGADGSIYPQTGIFHGLTQTTDSGLDNSQNIPKSTIITGGEQ